jgi:hypothetical protein
MLIRIRQYAFQVGEPHAGGDQMTPGEAQALNRLRAENIRNNLASVVAAELAACLPGQGLSPEALARLQAKFTQYDSTYKFQERYSGSSSQGPAPVTGALDRAIRAVAQARVEEALRAAGQELGPEALAKQVELACALPEVQAEGHRRAQEQAAVAKAALEELL